MKIVDVTKVETSKNPHGVDARQMYDAENAQAVHIRLKPGEALRKHITPTEVFFYVLEGRGVVEVGDEKQDVGPDMLIESPSGIPHCWYNKGDTDLRILVVKAPRPTTSTRLL